MTKVKEVKKIITNISESLIKPQKMAFGKKLKLLRRSRGLTGEILADLMRPILSRHKAKESKVSKGTVAGWEKRNDPPGHEIVLAYCEIFGMTEAQLRGIDSSGSLILETDKSINAMKENAKNEGRALTTPPLTGSETPDDLRDQVEELLLVIGHLRGQLKETRAKLAECMGTAKK